MANLMLSLQFTESIPWEVYYLYAYGLGTMPTHIKLEAMKSTESPCTVIAHGSPSDQLVIKHQHGKQKGQTYETQINAFFLSDVCIYVSSMESGPRAGKNSRSTGLEGCRRHHGPSR